MNKAGKDGMDTLQTMQKRSGIYQDRVDGKLPMDRVKGHYAQARLAQDAKPKSKHVVTEEEMKEGRKRAYIAEQAKKDAKAKKDALAKADIKKSKVDQAKADATKKAKKQMKADITEMDMDQAKIKAYQKSNP